MALVTKARLEAPADLAGVGLEDQLLVEHSGGPALPDKVITAAMALAPLILAVAGGNGHQVSSTYYGGAGGAGSASSISGTSTNYAGGGGAGLAKADGGIGGGGAGGIGSEDLGTHNGTVNTGGGGGGHSGPYAGSGGSGIVIIRYLTP